MKFVISFKTPDALNDLIKDQCDNLDPESDEYFFTKNSITDTTKKFMMYQEYINIEFDTETKTARVVPL